MTFIGVPSDAQLRARWKLLVGIGIVILILGLIALWNVVDATLVTVVFVGVMVLIAGIAQIIGAFVTGGSTGRRVLLGLLGVLYVIVGFNVVADPLRGAVALTIVIAIRPDVRRRKSRRMRGAAMPPRICAPATIAATRPAIW